MVRALLLSLMEQEVAGALVEVGAYDAAFSREVVERLPDTRALAFEANPYVYDGFAAELSEAGVDYRHLAISEGLGEVDLFVPLVFDARPADPVNKLSGLVPRTSEEAAQRVKVPSDSLDGVLGREDLRDPIALWIDVEGAQREVLAGAGKTLDRAMAVFIEVETDDYFEGQARAQEVLGGIRAKGFAPIARDIEAAKQYNVLLLRKALIAKSCEVILRHQAAILDAIMAAAPRSPQRRSGSSD